MHQCLLKSLLPCRIQVASPPIAETLKKIKRNLNDLLAAYAKNNAKNMCFGKLACAPWVKAVRDVVLDKIPKIRQNKTSSPLEKSYRLEKLVQCESRVQKGVDLGPAPLTLNSLKQNGVMRGKQ